jgi:hypothetical protein
VTFIQIYFIGATVISFLALRRIPGRLSPSEDAIGSGILAVATGWLLWPVYIYTAHHVAKTTTDDNPAS